MQTWQTYRTFNGQLSDIATRNKPEKPEILPMAKIERTTKGTRKGLIT